MVQQQTALQEAQQQKKLVRLRVGDPRREAVIAEARKRTTGKGREELEKVLRDPGVITVSPGGAGTPDIERLQIRVAAKERTFQKTTGQQGRQTDTFSPKFIDIRKSGRVVRIKRGLRPTMSGKRGQIFDPVTQERATFAPEGFMEERASFVGRKGAAVSGGKIKKREVFGSRGQVLRVEGKEGGGQRIKAAREFGFQEARARQVRTQLGGARTLRTRERQVLFDPLSLPEAGRATLLRKEARSQGLLLSNKQINELARQGPFGSRDTPRSIQTEKISTVLPTRQTSVTGPTGFLPRQQEVKTLDQTFATFSPGAGLLVDEIIPRSRKRRTGVTQELREPIGLSFTEILGNLPGVGRFFGPGSTPGEPFTPTPEADTRNIQIFRERQEAILRKGLDPSGQTFIFEPTPEADRRRIAQRRRQPKTDRLFTPTPPPTQLLPAVTPPSRTIPAQLFTPRPDSQKIFTADPTFTTRTGSSPFTESVKKQKREEAAQTFFEEIPAVALSRKEQRGFFTRLEETGSELVTERFGRFEERVPILEPSLATFQVLAGKKKRTEQDQLFTPQPTFTPRPKQFTPTPQLFTADPTFTTRKRKQPQTPPTRKPTFKEITTSFFRPGDLRPNIQQLGAVSEITISEGSKILRDELKTLRTKPVTTSALAIVSFLLPGAGKLGPTIIKKGAAKLVTRFPKTLPFIKKSEKVLGPAAKKISPFVGPTLAAGFVGFSGAQVALAPEDQRRQVLIEQFLFGKVSFASFKAGEKFSAGIIRLGTTASIFDESFQVGKDVTTTAGTGRGTQSGAVKGKAEIKVFGDKVDELDIQAQFKTEIKTPKEGPSRTQTQFSGKALKDDEVLSTVEGASQGIVSETEALEVLGFTVKTPKGKPKDFLGTQRSQIDIEGLEFGEVSVPGERVPRTTEAGVFFTQTKTTISPKPKRTQKVVGELEDIARSIEEATFSLQVKKPSKIDIKVKGVKEEPLFQALDEPVIRQTVEDLNIPFIKEPFDPKLLKKPLNIDPQFTRDVPITDVNIPFIRVVKEKGFPLPKDGFEAVQLPFGIKIPKRRVIKGTEKKKLQIGLGEEVDITFVSGKPKSVFRTESGEFFRTTRQAELTEDIIFGPRPKSKAPPKREPSIFDVLGGPLPETKALTVQTKTPGKITVKGQPEFQVGDLNLLFPEERAAILKGRLGLQSVGRTKIRGTGTSGGESAESIIQKLKDRGIIQDLGKRARIGGRPGLLQSLQQQKTLQADQILLGRADPTGILATRRPIIRQAAETAAKEGFLGSLPKIQGVITAPSSISTTIKKPKQQGKVVVVPRIRTGIVPEAQVKNIFVTRGNGLDRGDDTTRFRIPPTPTLPQPPDLKQGLFPVPGRTQPVPPGTFLVPKQLPRLGTGQGKKPDIIPTTDITNIVDTVPGTDTEILLEPPITITETITETTGGGGGFTPRPLTPFVPTPFFFSFPTPPPGALFRSPGVRARRPRRQQKRFTPTLRAIIFGLRGPAPKGRLTGLEARFLPGAPKPKKKKKKTVTKKKKSVGKKRRKK